MSHSLSPSVWIKSTQEVLDVSQETHIQCQIQRKCLTLARNVRTWDWESPFLWAYIFDRTEICVLCWQKWYNLHWVDPWKCTHLERLLFVLFVSMTVMHFMASWASETHWCNFIGMAAGCRGVPTTSSSGSANTQHHIWLAAGNMVKDHTSCTTSFLKPWFPLIFFIIAVCVNRLQWLGVCAYSVNPLLIMNEAGRIFTQPVVLHYIHKTSADVPFPLTRLVKFIHCAGLLVLGWPQIQPRFKKWVWWANGIFARSSLVYFYRSKKRNK